MKINQLYNIALISLLTLFSCEDNQSPFEDCNLTARSCTEEFRSIFLQIHDGNGNPIILDDFYTFFDSRTKFEFDLSDFQNDSGLYPVITDAEIEALDREGTILIFVGEKAGVNVVEHQMVIGHDCCHVQLIEGESEIMIELR